MTGVMVNSILGGNVRLDVEIEALERSGEQVQRAKDLLERFSESLSQSIEVVLEDWQTIIRESAQYRELRLGQDCLVMPEEPDGAQQARFNAAMEQLRKFIEQSQHICGELEQARESAFGAARQYKEEDNWLVKFMDKIALPFSSWALFRTLTDPRAMSTTEKAANLALPPDSYAKEFFARTVANNFRGIGEFVSPYTFDASPDALIKKELESPKFTSQAEVIRHARAESLKDPGAVLVYTWLEGDHKRFYVYIPGTTSWKPGDTTHPLGASSNVDTMYSGESASVDYVMATLAAAGIKKGDIGTIVGHSQGGMVAKAVTNKLAEDDNAAKVDNVITLESPSGRNEIPEDIQSLHVENTRDYVPFLDGTMNATDRNSVTIIGTEVEEGRHDPLGAAKIIEAAACNPAVAEQLALMDKALPPEGTEVSAMSYQVDTHVDWTEYFVEERLNPKSWLELHPAYNATSALVQTVK